MINDGDTDRLPKQAHEECKIICPRCLVRFEIDAEMCCWCGFKLPHSEE